MLCSVCMLDALNRVVRKSNRTTRHTRTTPQLRSRARAFAFGEFRQEGGVVAAHDRWRSVGAGQATQHGGRGRHRVIGRWINVDGGDDSPNLRFLDCWGPTAGRT
jgi:hypothetical protein